MAVIQVMQFFDLNRQFNLNDILTPRKTLHDLSHQEWFLYKIRVEHNCVEPDEVIQGSAVLQSNQNIQLELEWIIVDSGYDLQVLFKGIETDVNDETLIHLKGAHLVDEQGIDLSTQALSLWIDGTLLPMIPHIRREIKSRLNLWDYVEYDV